MEQLPWEALWYCVLVIAVLAYTVLDGFDLGVGALHLFSRTDEQRRLFLNSIGPFWDGNEVWIVIILGGLFAGFPDVYATVLSGFYTLMMVLIAGLMFRAAAIEFRSKRPSKRWRSLWDTVFSISSIAVAFTVGVILGNLVTGVPINGSQDYVGIFTDLFRPYPILVGITAVALLAMHGSIYLLMKLEGEALAMVRRWMPRTIVLFLFFYGVTTIATLIHIPRMTQPFADQPLLAIFPILSLIAILNVPIQAQRERYGWAFLSSCASISLLLVLFAIGTFPTIVYSTLDPAVNSLTIYNTASTHKTLQILMLIVLLGVPMVLAYTAWIYRMLRGKVQLDHMSY
jgi:cytochrome d ubiquinol oxidase subunit II